MTPLDKHQPTRTPSDIRAANLCAVAAVALGVCFAFYYLLISVGAALAPRPGLLTMWLTAIGILTMVKISSWSVCRRVEVIEAQFAADAARREAELEEFRGLVRELRTVADRLRAEGDESARLTIARTGQFLDEQASSVTYMDRSRHGS